MADEAARDCAASLRALKHRRPGGGLGGDLRGALGNTFDYSGQLGASQFSHHALPAPARAAAGLGGRLCPGPAGGHAICQQRWPSRSRGRLVDRLASVCEWALAAGAIVQGRRCCGTASEAQIPVGQLPTGCWASTGQPVSEAQSVLHHTYLWRRPASRTPTPTCSPIPTPRA